jgi:hypothetical protein
MNLPRILARRGSGTGQAENRSTINAAYERGYFSGVQSGGTQFQLLGFPAFAAGLLILNWCQIGAKLVPNFT